MPTTTVTDKDTRVLGEIADSIARSKKAIVVTGAGISTNCGIPVSRRVCLNLENFIRDEAKYGVLTDNRIFVLLMASTTLSSPVTPQRL